MSIIQTDKKLFDLKDFVGYSKTFIETGTCVGDGVQRALDAGFEIIHTVEIHKPYFQEAFDRFLMKSYASSRDMWGPKLLLPHNTTIQMWLGNTLDHLPKMIGLDRPLVIFLDAHPSGPGTAGHDDLMEKGEASEFHQDNIIEKELDIVLRRPHSDVIMIDDMNGLNDSSQWHIDHIKSVKPSYSFSFHDQQLGDNLYKEKILVCVPFNFVP